MSIFIKHVLDFCASSLLLIALLPVFLIIALLIKIDSRGPIFFKQERVGKDGRLFMMYKFRTMVDNAINIGLGLRLAKNDVRITTVGKYLRDWSLDELPQLFNIIKGDMSIIGPRPTLQDQVQHYNTFQQKRLSMKPGVTGWAQVNGRNDLIWEERMPLDVWYIEHYSLSLDAKILFRTFGVWFTQQGLYSKTGINEGYNPKKVSM
jgi:undecaprenyl phosphate N,N'-diacetylbacillosamine 1-phosphate transferase